MSTRDVQAAQLIADRVGILHRGKMVAIGSVDEILKNNGQGFTLNVLADRVKLLR